MAFTQSETEIINLEMDAYIARIRPKQEIRDKVDISYKISGQSVEIFEIRPDMKGVILNTPIAKTTYIRTDNTWKILWMRADLKWHTYETPLVKSLKEFIKIVDNDEFGCFWG